MIFMSCFAYAMICAPRCIHLSVGALVYTRESIPVSCRTEGNLKVFFFNSSLFVGNPVEFRWVTKYIKNCSKLSHSIQFDKKIYLFKINYINYLIWLLNKFLKLSKRNYLFKNSLCRHVWPSLCQTGIFVIGCPRNSRLSESNGGRIEAQP